MRFENDTTFWTCFYLLGVPMHDGCTVHMCTTHLWYQRGLLFMGLAGWPRCIRLFIIKFPWKKSLRHTTLPFRTHSIIWLLLLAKKWIERDRYREIAMDREKERERDDDGYLEGIDGHSYTREYPARCDHSFEVVHTCIRRREGRFVFSV